MKKILLFLTLFPTFAMANLYSVDTIVMTRDHDEQIEKTQITLTELKSETHLEGKYFRILRKDTDEVIQIDPSGENLESLRAQTAYYQLNKARLYYKRIGVEQTELLTVRIGIENQFHKKYHFQHTSKEKLYNNAHTFAPGGAIDKLGVKSWGKEIWLRDPKSTELPEEFKENHRELVRSMIPLDSGIDLESLAYTAVNSLAAKSPMSYLKNTGSGILTNYATNMALKFIVPELSLLLTGDEFHIDAALVPEVVMHEYTHFMMSDHIPTVENTPIMEGLADYFTTKITNNSKIAHELGDYGELILHRDAENEMVYQHFFDNPNSASLGTGTAYVLSVLTLIDNYLTKHEGADFAAKAFFSMRKHITVNSKIHGDLPRAILRSIPRRYRLGVIAIFNNTGL